MECYPGVHPGTSRLLLSIGLKARLELHSLSLFAEDATFCS